jgi:hypothetical protein
MPNRPEAALERAVLARVGALQRADLPSLVVYKNEVGAGFTGNAAHLCCDRCRVVLQRHRITYGLGTGSPDLVGAVDGRAFGLELKSPTGRTRPEQDAWHEAARRRGVPVAVVRTVEEAEEAIRQAMR